MDELTTKLISGTEGSTAQPFFSPDGKWVGYFSDGDRKLKKISVNGGAPVALCVIAGWDMVGASWSADDRILFIDRPNGVMRISASGGTPDLLFKKSDLFQPQILPDGKGLLYVDEQPQPRIMVQPLISGEPRELLPGWLAGYLPTGHIIYWPPDDDTLFAVPFDLNKLDVGEEPVPVVENVSKTAISDSGTLVYTQATQDAAAAPSHSCLGESGGGGGNPRNSTKYLFIS